MAEQQFQPMEQLATHNREKSSIQPLRMAVRKSLTIAPSTGRDLATVLRYLKSEWDGSGFYGNRAAIEEAHSLGKMVVLRENYSAVAFSVLGISRINIFWVRPISRRKGYGRLLAMHCFDQLRTEGNTYAVLECNPGSSRPFWEAMGCEITEPEPTLSQRLGLGGTPKDMNLSQEERESLMPAVQATRKL
jgi:GNAT superfamily N-acetyltransferase